MRPYQKLTPQQLSHLHTVVTTILQSTTTPTKTYTLSHTASQQDSNTLNLLLGEIENSKNVTAELANMTCMILEEMGLCLQEWRDLREELGLWQERVNLACLELAETKEKMELLTDENHQLRINGQSFRNERDINIFKYQLAVSTHEKQKQQLLLHIHKLEQKLDRIPHTKAVEQKKIQSLNMEISQLHQSNARLQEEIFTMKALQSNQIISEHQAQLKLDLNDKATIQREFQPETSIRETDVEICRSSLRYELMNPLPIGDNQYNLQTARYRPDYEQSGQETARYNHQQNQRQRKYKTTHIQELSEKDTNRDKSLYQYDIYSEIGQESREDLDEKQFRMKHSTEKMKNLQKDALKMRSGPQLEPKQLIDSKAKPTDNKDGISKFRKPNDKMSRIKCILNALGGDSDQKREKTQKFKPKKSRIEMGENQPRKRLAIKRLITNETSCTMTPVSSVNFLRKQNQL